jgi:hypothetical protein
MGGGFFFWRVPAGCCLTLAGECLIAATWRTPIRVQSNQINV